MFYSFIKVLFYIPIKLLYPTKVIGKQNIINGKSILICNHYSNLDVFILIVNLKPKISFLAKAELFKNGFYNWFFKNMKAIKVNRGKADLRATKTVLHRLNNNEVVGIFPSGTRTNIKNNKQEYKKGVAMFSIKTNSPIIPMKLVKKPKLFSKNKLIICKPFTTSNNKTITQEKLAKVTKQIEETQAKIQTQNKGEK